MTEQTIFHSIRSSAPRVHCVTNQAASVLSANGLLAIGAIPSLSFDPGEIGEFVASSNALLINCGTLDPVRKEAVHIAIHTAKAAGIPWVLDPVFCERSSDRLAFVTSLLSHEPTVIKANSAEAAALFPGGADRPSEAAARTKSLVVLTGENNIVACPHSHQTIPGGSTLMARTTAMGCLLGAAIAAALTVNSDPQSSIFSMVKSYNLAGSKVEEMSAGPGTFVPHFLDQLYRMSGE